MNFKDFNFNPSILEGIEAMGYTTPTPIQEQAIPVILAHKDLIACAQTGTGKTAAFLLPVLNHITTLKNRSKHVDTLIIVPTRELALQIDQQIEGMAYFVPVSSISVYGGGDGSSWDEQKNALIAGAEIVIAAPGRLLSHINLGYVDFSHLKHLILDEADRMLDMGFYDDIMKIVEHLPVDRQTLMFSATMPHKIRAMAKAILRNHTQINIAVSKPAEGIIQAAYMVKDNLKLPLIRELLKGKSDIESVLIFSSTKKNVKDTEKEISRLGLSVRAIHSDLEQTEREEVMRDFKNRKFRILVATDVISRGIDIEGIDLVLNYDVPHDAEDYIHRIGRTARAESTGVALTFVNEKDRRYFKKIEDFLHQEIFKIPLPPGLK